MRSISSMMTLCLILNSLSASLYSRYFDSISLQSETQAYGNAASGCLTAAASAGGLTTLLSLAVCFTVSSMLALQSAMLSVWAVWLGCLRFATKSMYSLTLRTPKKSSSTFLRCRYSLLDPIRLIKSISCSKWLTRYKLSAKSLTLQKMRRTSGTLLRLLNSF